MVTRRRQPVEWNSRPAAHFDHPKSVCGDYDLLLIKIGQFLFLEIFAVTVRASIVDCPAGLEL